MATIPEGKELCGQCGGDGFIPVEWSDYADWHSCYRCGETGYLPAGTAEREEAAAEADLASLAGRPARIDDEGFETYADEWYSL